MKRGRRFAPFNMSGCVLWAPMHLIHAASAKMWDFSGNNNNGTINAPVVRDLPVYGPNKVTNGKFSADSGWTKGAGWSIGGSVATKTAGVASDLEQDISAVSGETYRLLYYLSRTAGTLTPQIGGQDGTARTGAVWCSELITATGTGNLKFQAGDTYAGSVRLVSVRKVTGLYHSSFSWGWDGSDDLVTFGTGASLKPAVFTIMGWVAGLPTNSAANGGGQVATFSSAGSNPACHLGYGAALNPWAYMGSSNYQPFNVPSSNPYGHYLDGTWHHFAMTIPGSADADVASGQFFVDGVSLAKGTPGTAGAQGTKNGFYCGNTVTPISVNVGEIALFNRVLATEEILSHWQLTRHRYGV